MAIVYQVRDFVACSTWEFLSDYTDMPDSESTRSSFAVRDLFALRKPVDIVEHGEVPSVHNNIPFSSGPIAEESCSPRHNIPVPLPGVPDNPSAVTVRTFHHAVHRAAGSTAEPWSSVLETERLPRFVPHPNLRFPAFVWTYGLVFCVFFRDGLGDASP